MDSRVRPAFKLMLTPVEEDRRRTLLALPRPTLVQRYFELSARRGRNTGEVPKTLIGRETLADLIILYERHSSA